MDIKKYQGDIQTDNKWASRYACFQMRVSLSDNRVLTGGSVGSGFDETETSGEVYDAGTDIQIRFERKSLFNSARQFVIEVDDRGTLYIKTLPFPRARFGLRFASEPGYERVVFCEADNGV